MTAGSAPSPEAGSAAYVLAVADDAMVYAQRLGEWLTNAPQIEEDMALANVSLDLLGQARALYARVGELDGSGRGEDDYAMFRDERQWRNVHLVEQERGDFAREMARMLWFASYQHELYAAQLASSDPVVAGVAGKAAKEVRYHLDHARHWVLRLGDGTDESHRRMQAALEWAAPYVDELFDDHAAAVTAVEAGLVARLPSELREAAQGRVEAVVSEATLTMPDPPTWRSRGGRDGIHSRPMGYLLAELQHISRSHPGATW
ncbi:phenylacetic acid degradation protein [Intrasporangium chromatireducens Q5-1]|uniref:Phenylacetic acid degradation protein n=1 Tax=Intrasporangium chromatireducens Q5-1 TaxID=584657 RepID=W9GPH1_9MICO|nr:1,2-phenylacetyl-CoA epoxidase subunit PaaC [Intrasporangium chromatireducens]EWT06723.1 phenylacetic acid degradation protein [Intrasporangium chromatireducens Q5-1]